MINFLNLEYFLAAAQDLNFTKAARRLSISQQSLSNHISNLERELDILLFNRTTPLTLTYAGRVFLVRAKQLLNLKDEMYREMADIKDFSTGQLSIGVSHTRGRAVLPAILPAYRRKFPNIELHLAEGNSTELDLALAHGDVDLIIGLLPFRTENVETVPICDEEILLAVPGQILEKFFTGRQDEVKSQLERCGDVAILEHCPCLLIKKGNRVRTIADEIFEDAQITPNLILETENIETVIALAARGMGFTFYPRMLMSGGNSVTPTSESGSSLNFYSLNCVKTHGILAVGYHKERYLSQATREFIDIAKKMCKKV